MNGDVDDDANRLCRRSVRGVVKSIDMNSRLSSLFLDRFALMHAQQQQKERMHKQLQQRINHNNVVASTTTTTQNNIDHKQKIDLSDAPEPTQRALTFPTVNINSDDASASPSLHQQATINALLRTPKHQQHHHQHHHSSQQQQYSPINLSKAQAMLRLHTSKNASLQNESFIQPFSSSNIIRSGSISSSGAITPATHRVRTANSTNYSGSNTPMIRDVDGESNKAIRQQAEIAMQQQKQQQYTIHGRSRSHSHDTAQQQSTSPWLLNRASSSSQQQHHRDVSELQHNDELDDLSPVLLVDPLQAMITSPLSHSNSAKRRLPLPLSPRQQKLLQQQQQAAIDASKQKQNKKYKVIHSPNLKAAPPKRSSIAAHNPMPRVFPSELRTKQAAATLSMSHADAAALASSEAEFKTQQADSNSSKPRVRINARIRVRRFARLRSGGGGVPRSGGWPLGMDWRIVTIQDDLQSSASSTDKLQSCDAIERINDSGAEHSLTIVEPPNSLNNTSNIKTDASNSTTNNKQQHQQQQQQRRVYKRYPCSNTAEELPRLNEDERRILLLSHQDQKQSDLDSESPLTADSSSSIDQSHNNNSTHHHRNRRKQKHAKSQIDGHNSASQNNNNNNDTHDNQSIIILSPRSEKEIALESLELEALRQSRASQFCKCHPEPIHKRELKFADDSDNNQDNNNESNQDNDINDNENEDQSASLKCCTDPDVCPCAAAGVECHNEGNAYCKCIDTNYTSLRSPLCGQLQNAYSIG
jgi:hypothetical protein